MNKLEKVTHNAVPRLMNIKESWEQLDHSDHKQTKHGKDEGGMGLGPLDSYSIWRNNRGGVQ